MVGEFYKHYGLTGKRIRMQMMNLADGDETVAQGAPNPWASCGEITVKVVHESKYCLTVEIPPHRNPRGWDESTPYCTSIHKHDLQIGKVVLRTLGGEKISPGRRRQVQPTQDGHRWGIYQ